MFVGDSPYFFKVLRNMAFELGLALIASLIAVALHVAWSVPHVAIPTTSITIVGAALAIFLAFRNSAAYDRHWEARKLWGALINNSRNLGRQILTLVTPPPETPEGEVAGLQKRVIYAHLAYITAFRCALRDQKMEEELKPFLDEDDRAGVLREQNVPSAVMHRQAELIREFFTRGWLSDYRFTQIDSTLSEVTNVQGGCERIKNTPMPRAYNYFTRHITEVYCVVLPFGLVEHLGYRTPVLAMLVSFMFLVLERIGRLLEHPFGMRHNDLALSAMCRTIEINLRQRLGETDVPAPLKPVDGVLL